MKLQKTHVAALALAGVLTATVASPSFAIDRWTAAGAGFVAGAVVGSAAANSYYGPGYANQPYGYAPRYGYAYAPAPGYAYAAPGYSYAPSYNPEQPMDPDPRIGGAARLNNAD